MMQVEVPSLRELMQAGAHFGHKKEKTYPKAKKFVYLLKDQIYVIDLEKTQDALREALEYIKNLVNDGKTILFVGTKRQAQKIVTDAAKKAGMPYMSERWLGGALTNFETIRRRLKYIEEMDARLNKEGENLTKKEKAKLQEEADKLHRVYDGIKDLKRLPDALFIVDVSKEKTAVIEAEKMGIPVVGIADTNANPDLIKYPIPANDDAQKAIELIVSLVAKQIEQSKGNIKEKVDDKKADEKEE